MRWQGKSRRKFTGGRLVYSRGKKKYEMGREPSETHIGEERKKILRTRGGNRKIRVLRANMVSVTDPETGKTKKVGMEVVVSNPANQHYVRRNVITKGAVVKTDLGDARVTSRPGQDGTVNAVLIKAE
ncbi:MAG: 30S ribosomal protein S8e [Halobacteriota archaeon]|nr:30S ribosomal protein S8e [Halobacteriota archaeon]